MIEKMVSVIVPVYNMEQYLCKCIDSLVAQTYRNIEVILVDDGSTDASSLLCDEWVNKDTRICVLHKQNGGLSSARKMGLDNAKGEYVMIVDADDWLELDTVEQCVNKMINENLDCVLFSYYREYKDSAFINKILDATYEKNIEVHTQNIYRRLIGPSKRQLAYPQKVDNLSSVCMKLYKKDIALKGRIIDEKIVGTSEDTIFNIWALWECERIGYIDKCFYHYRKTNASSICTTYKKGLPEKWDVLYQIIEQFLKEKKVFELYYEAFMNRVACCTIGLGLNEIASPESLFNKSRKIKEILNKPLYKEAMKCIDIAYCPLKWKVFFVLCRYRMTFFLVMMLYCIDFVRNKFAE